MNAPGQATIGQGRLCVITGASRGIGLALGREFAACGFRVVSASRSAPDEATGFGWVKADVCVPEGREAIAAVVAADGEDGLAVLINNAGRGIQETWEDMGEADLRAVMELNFFAPVALSKRLLPELKLANGTVINVSSAAGKVGVACMGGYCASKFALSAFSESLRAEIGPSGVRVLNLIVGRIATGFGDRVLGERTAPKTPGMVASPEKLARAVLRAYRRRRREIVFPGYYRPLLWIARHVPGYSARLGRRAWKLE